MASSTGRDNVTRVVGGMGRSARCETNVELRADICIKFCASPAMADCVDVRFAEGTII